jgi:hypothetical protein
MRVDPAEVVARVDGYFRMQSLVDSPELRRYLHVRNQTLLHIVAAYQDPTGVSAAKFDLKLTGPTAKAA